MLTPLAFEPIFKSMIWGGQRLPQLWGRAALAEQPIGEAWVLSDVEGSVSQVAAGPWQGKTLRELIQHEADAVFGPHMPADRRFPLLLKFIDARQELSVQVHPNDEQAQRWHGPEFRGKTEAWVVLEADPTSSQIYAGFRPGLTESHFRDAMTRRTTPDTLHRFTPKPGDCVFLEAGTVHAIGANILLFEVQQTSDITYRLYDWDRVDKKTGQPRELHIERGLACSNFAAGPCQPITPQPNEDGQDLVECRHFLLRRRTTDKPLSVGKRNTCRVVIGFEGVGELCWQGWRGTIRPGQVYLIPASVGVCELRPNGPVTVLECGLAE